MCSLTTQTSALAPRRESSGSDKGAGLKPETRGWLIVYLKHCYSFIIQTKTAEPVLIFRSFRLN